MTPPLLERPITDAELTRAEMAWSAGERGRSVRATMAAQSRAQAEAVYDTAFARVQTERTPEVLQAERELARTREEARQTWRLLYLEEERARRQAKECWAAAKREVLARGSRRPAL